MKINAVNNTSFQAKFSPELESKVVALGTHLLRDGNYADYNEMKRCAKIIKEVFPNGTIKLKPTSRIEIVYDINDKPIFKMPTTRYGIYLERYGENDIALGRDSIFSSQFRMSLEHFTEMSRRLSCANDRINYIEKASPEKKEIIKRVIDDLI